MAFGRDHGFAHDMSQISPDRKVPIEADCSQSGSGNKTSADAEKSPQNADDESNDPEVNWADVSAGNREEHGYVDRRRMTRRRKLVTNSSTTAWPTMSAMATMPYQPR